MVKHSHQHFGTKAGIDDQHFERWNFAFACDELKVHEINKFQRYEIVCDPGKDSIELIILDGLTDTSSIIAGKRNEISV